MVASSHGRTVVLVVDSATGYTLVLDDQDIGRVEKQRDGWRWRTADGKGYGGAATRRLAIDSVVQLAIQNGST